MLVGRKRLELLTSSTSRMRSSQLSYRPIYGIHTSKSAGYMQKLGVL